MTWCFACGGDEDDCVCDVPDDAGASDQEPPGVGDVDDDEEKIRDWDAADYLEDAADQRMDIDKA